MIHNVTKVVQERVSMANSTSKTMMYNCEGPLNAVALNKDATKAVVAGRTVFKIISIDEDSFSEGSNLRVGKSKNMNLNYSAADVAWNHVDENMLASAATNGSVVIWNLSKSSRNKQEHVFGDHKRSVNRVCFHGIESHLLLSGSQDGSMMLFDVRKKAVSTVFAGKGTESVRDVQFHPSQFGYFYFGAAYDNGNIQIWDMRRTDRCERQFTAHSGPVFCLDWHPEDKNLLATAGRDKMVKIWETNLAQAKMLHSVQTIASVTRIKWRPQRKYHIATCSLLLDHTINIWDIRRPYIPFATFDEHKDVVTSIIWKEDSHTFLSSGKDNLLIQHVFRDAKRPADQVVPAGIDMNVTGDISHAIGEKYSSAKSNHSGGRLSFFRKTPDRSEQFMLANSSMFVFMNAAQEHLLMDWFVALAKTYRLTGNTLEKLCEYNAAAAVQQGKHKIAQSWRMLVNLYGAIPSTPGHSQGHLSRTGSISAAASMKADLLADKVSPAVAKGGASGPSEKIPDSITQDQTSSNRVTTDGTSGNSDDDSEGENSEIDKNITDITIGLTNQSGDFFFGDGEAEIIADSLDTLPNLDNNPEEWMLPNEAFQPRHEIANHANPLRNLENYHESLMTQPLETENHGVSTLSEPEDNDLVITSEAFKASDWDFSSIVVDTLKAFAEQGDVQTPVSMIIVLNDKIRNHIDEATQENWFLNYIDLLHRFSLWRQSNLIIKLSHLPMVSMLNQQSTTIHNLCTKCSRPLHHAGWVCARCRNVTNLCCICHLPVKGLFVWCQGCCHGGHLAHIEEWLSENIYCPTGCGHRCEYT